MPKRRCTTSLGQYPHCPVCPSRFLVVVETGGGCRKQARRRILKNMSLVYSNRKKKKKKHTTLAGPRDVVRRLFKSLGCSTCRPSCSPVVPRCHCRAHVVVVKIVGGGCVVSKKC
jgi:hypothetical protein